MHFSLPFIGALTNVVEIAQPTSVKLICTVHRMKSARITLAIWLYITFLFFKECARMKEKKKENKK